MQERERMKVKRGKKNRISRFPNTYMPFYAFLSFSCHMTSVQKAAPSRTPRLTLINVLTPPPKFPQASVVCIIYNLSQTGVMYGTRLNHPNIQEA